MRSRDRDVTISLDQTNYTVSESGTTAGYGVSVCLNITGKGHGPSRNSIDLQFTSSGTASGNNSLCTYTYSIYTTHTAIIGKDDVLYCISEGSDFILSGNQTIWRTDSGGEWNGQYCLQAILLCDDLIPENNESATIIISSTTSHVILTEESFTLVIIDNDCKKHSPYKLFELSAKLVNELPMPVLSCLQSFQ